MSDEDMFVKLREMIANFRSQIDAAMASGKMPIRMEYRDDGSEVFVARITKLSERIFRLESPHQLVDRIHVPYSVFENLVFEGEPARSYAYVTKHGDMIQIQLGFMRAIGFPEAADFHRDLRLLLGMPTATKSTELN